MNTKTLALSLTVGLFSSSVFAIAPTVTPDIEFFLAGSSTQDVAMGALFSTLCVPNTLDTYKDGTAPNPSGTNHIAFYCQLDVSQMKDGDTDGVMHNWVIAHPGVNPRVLFHKRVAGGSGVGVTSVLYEDAIERMVINNGNCAETATGSRLWACNITNAGNTINAIPDAAISDVNPEMFVGENVQSGYATVNAVKVQTDLTVVPGAAMVYGIPVTEPLYRALQRIQGKDYTSANRDNEANMPSLSREEVGSIMTGRIKNWNQFMIGSVGLRDAVVNAGGTAPSSSFVNICRRVNGSGTQVQMSARFLNYPCTPSAVAPSVTNNPFLGPKITLNSSADAVDACLVNATNQNVWAVGIQSMAKNHLVDTNSDAVPDAYPLAYRFIKIDHAAPTIENAAEGKYFDWVESTYQWRRVGGTGGSTPAYQLSGDKLDIIYTIVQDTGSAPVIRDVMNANLIYAFGRGGYLALDTNGTNTPSFPFTENNPVMPYTHTFGGGLDNCRFPVVYQNAAME